jgi:hypothetical protein
MALPLIGRIRPISVPLTRPVAVFVLARRHGTAAVGIVVPAMLAVAIVPVAADADIGVGAAGTDSDAGTRRGPMVPILGLRWRRAAAQQNRRRESEHGKSKRSESSHPHLLSCRLSPL